MGIPPKPRVDIYTLRNATEISKELGITAIKLNAFLVSKGVLVKNEFCYEPTEEYKYLEDEHIHTVLGPQYATLKWTPKGVEWLKDFWQKSQ